MCALKILCLLGHLNLALLSSTSDFNLVWYEANKTEPHFYSARSTDSLEKATRIVLNQKISVLRSFDLGLAGNLKTLIMDNCGLTDIEPESFKNLAPLIELAITRNNIRVIKEGVFNYMDVQHLNLSYNKIHTIKPTAFDHMKNLRSVILDHNEITLYALWFQSCPNITLISVKHNFIQYLPEGAFKSIKNHKLNLYFSYNKIQKVENDVFDVNEIGDFCLDHNEMGEFDFRLKKVHNIDLQDNHIGCLSDEFLKNELGKVTVLNLKENPVNCSCLGNLQSYKNILATSIEEGC